MLRTSGLVATATSLEFSPSAFQFPRKRGFIRQRGLILGREDLVRQVVQRVMGLRSPLLCAQDQPNRGILPGLHPVFARAIEIEAHLTGVRVAEAPYLEVNDKQTSQSSMEKHQVYTEPGVINAEAPLPADEGEIVAELQQEVSEVLNQRGLEIRLRVFVLHIEEFEYKRIANCLFGRQQIARLRCCGFSEERRLVAGQRQPLVELAADLAAHGNSPINLIEGWLRSR